MNTSSVSPTMQKEPGDKMNKGKPSNRESTEPAAQSPNTMALPDQAPRRAPSTFTPPPDNRKKQVVLMKQIRNLKIRLTTDGESLSDVERKELEKEMAGQMERLQTLRKAAGQEELPSQSLKEDRPTGADTPKAASENEGEKSLPVMSQGEKKDNVESSELPSTNSNESSGNAAVKRLKSTSKAIGKASQAGKKKGDCRLM